MLTYDYMHLPLVNLGVKSQPNSFDGHPFETLSTAYFRQAFVNSLESWTILDVSPLELDRQSFIFKILLQLEELDRNVSLEAKVSSFQELNCINEYICFVWLQINYF